ncbi:MAG: mechanosensitive ion channel family protein [Bacteroidota bacterium]
MKEIFTNNLLPVSIFVIIIIATLFAAYLVNRFFKRLIKKSAEEMKNDPTNYQFLRHTVVAIVYILGFGAAIYAIPGLRAIANTMLAGAGVLAVAVGFASQQALSNIISGLFIVIFKPFKINDRLKIRDLVGAVEDITLRHTVIRDLENKRILIPNAVISNEIITNSDFVNERLCRWIEVGISYDSDIDLAKTIMREEVEKHALHLDPRTPEQIESGAPKVPVRVLSLGNSSVNLRAWAWAKDAADAFVLGCDVIESIKKRFDREGIEIPFPHQTIVMKNKNLN